MKYITQSKFENELAKIRVRNKSYERKKLLKAEKNKYRNKIKLPSTTKLVMTYLFILLNTVLIYAMIAMWHFSDLSYLGVLITDIVAQLITFFIYTVKSTKENTVGGITYDLAMKQSNIDMTNMTQETTDETTCPVG